MHVTSLLVELRVVVAWLAMTWERLWRHLWAPATALGGLLALALTDILPSLPGLLHATVIVGALIGIVWLAIRNVGGLQWPTRGMARARLEKSAPLLHRPLTTVEDRLESPGDAVSAALWAAHRTRAAYVLDQLRPSMPAPGVAGRDRWTLRAAAVVAIAIGFVGAGDDAGPRIIRALTPSLDAESGAISAKVWLTPPAYTNKSPMYVEYPAPADRDAGLRLSVPEGSALLAIVTGTSRQTDVRVDDQTFPMSQVGDNSQRLEIRIPDGRRLELTQRGRALAGWDFDVLPDLPPEISFGRDPREAGRGRLRVEYRASDDYGIGSVVARLEPATEIEAKVADAFEAELTAPPFNPKTATAASFLDLSAHPWAGMQVRMTLRVSDQANQTADSETLLVTLPERVFNHPVARELAMLRKGIIVDFPGAAGRSAIAVDRILKAPDRFGGDPRVILFLSSARGRLAPQPLDQDARSIADLLWHGAIRIEDGNLLEAEQRLAAAEQALREAMERGASPQEISQLIDQLKQALAEFARELAERMPDSELANLNPEQGSQTIGPEDIANAMDRLRDMAQLGATDAAKQAMAELQEMLQSLRGAAMNQGDNPEVKAAQELMRDMRELTEKQSELLEESFQKAREAALEGRKQNRADGDPNAGARQENLRQQLGDVMGRMGEMAGQIPDGMGGAEAAMRRARDNLNSGAFKSAADAQGEALASLQQSLEQANEQLMQSLADKGLAGMVPMPGKDRKGFDPSGRRTGPENGENVELPEGPDAEGVSERVRAILEEIRRRAADRTRPVDEQDYLRRLMKQF